MSRIVIDGNIGSGKSTLLDVLKTVYTVYTEDIEAWGDWLPCYYKNQKKYAFGFQLSVLLSHLKQQNSPIKDKITIFERSTYSCNAIFGQLLVKDGLMSELEYSLCTEYSEAFDNPIKYTIYLQCMPSICYSRICERSRDCETSIPYSYIEKLHAQYEEVYRDSKKIFKIDANKPADQVYSQVLSTLDYISELC